MDSDDSLDPNVINADLFFGEGRGPELERVHWESQGTRLKALDYFTPDVPHEPMNLKHVRFSGVQVVMITSDEVVAEPSPIVATETGAFMYDMGRDSWFRSFAPKHLESCSHYKLVFYDEVFDLIAASLECRMGAFSESSPHE